VRCNIVGVEAGAAPEVGDGRRRAVSALGRQRADNLLGGHPAVPGLGTLQSLRLVGVERVKSPWSVLYTKH